MIRVATEEDLPRLLELGKMMHGESENYRGISYDEDKVRATLKELIDGAGVIFLYESMGKVYGGIAGALSEFWFSRERLASDLSLFVEPSHRNGLIAVKLSLAFLNWAKLVGARRVQLGITTGAATEKASSLYRSLGLEDSGQLFKKDFS